MDLEFTKRFQTVVRADYVFGLGKVDEWLSKTAGTGLEAPPKAVKDGDKVWVARQCRDGAGKCVFQWDAGHVTSGGSQAVVRVKFQTYRKQHEVPLRHIRTAPPPRTSSDSEVEVLLPPTFSSPRVTPTSRLSLLPAFTC
uniref:Uncharacterized protein n=1 Tax=Eutreptiella gymnastica TaxID=73025 RepID=A0A7S1ILA7_9EUGL|mmetsp:Transcript_2680/g.4775  ORF Transcript_2680/g.4775 Transcript_2680/m.4775 type:complete len:140 (+) Transcript_2680:40-459(+)